MISMSSRLWKNDPTLDFHYATMLFCSHSAVPQFILDSLILSDRGSETSIVVTQPRRLAAISVANRVSAERLNDGLVGYAVRGETKVTEKTRLLFCTTGVALRRMTSGDQLRGVSHVVVDEVCNNLNAKCGN